MRILILLLALFPASVFADIGDTYVCDEKEKRWAVDRFVLTWSTDFYERRFKKGTIPAEYKKVNFLTNEENYFTAVEKEFDGWEVLIAFDGSTFTEVLVEEGYTGIAEYICEKF